MMALSKDDPVVVLEAFGTGSPALRKGTLKGNVDGFFARVWFHDAQAVHTIGLHNIWPDRPAVVAELREVMRRDAEVKEAQLKLSGDVMKLRNRVTRGEV